MAESYQAILLAAGSAKRFNHPTRENKLLMPLNGRPVFDYSLRLFMEDARCRILWFVVSAANEASMKDHVKTLYPTMPEKIRWVHGGEERQDSVSRALDCITLEAKTKVVVHDAARPFISQLLLDRLLQAGNHSSAATLGIPAKDSMKIVRDSKVCQSLYRPEVWHIQTPQVFDSWVLKEAMSKAENEQFYGNEEAELVERLGFEVAVVRGSDTNFKLTTAFDYQVAKMLEEAGES